MNHRVHAYQVTNTATTTLSVAKGAEIHGVIASGDGTHADVIATINPDSTIGTHSVVIYQYALDADIPSSVFPHLRYLGTVLYSSTPIAVFVHD
jgi:hypothetical protein